MKKIYCGALLFFTLFSFNSLNCQWARTYGGTGDDEAHAIQQTRDGGYIIGAITLFPHGLGAFPQDTLITILLP